jgi:hypothetical protein
MITYKEYISTLLESTVETALRKKSQESGISTRVLKRVYARGMAAWNSSSNPGGTPQQWAMARVNSYISKGKTYHTTDKDLREDILDEIEIGDGFIFEDGSEGEIIDIQIEELDEAEYQGRKVELNKPTKGDVKKSKVYVKNEKGNVVKV